MKAGEITESQDEVAAFLADPATHGGAAVRRIDTHAAMVFLAGDRAIKLKRAVWFPFLDFSTVEKRRLNCEREVALNRRTAPSLYLGAVPVTRTKDGRLQIDGCGKPVDWIVIMRRFDDSALLDDMAGRGTLTRELMLDLADTIAAFHREAERVTEAGGLAGMRWVVEDNIEELSEMKEIVAPSSIDEFAAESRTALGRVASTLEARRKGGYVRRCHGDLHLRNICLLDGRPTLFDCIEFNDAIACIDTFYDLAFLLMDLDHRGHRPFANLVFNRYIARTADTGGLVPLALFLSCRAAVRAKVEAARAMTAREVGPAREARKAARAYLERAQIYLRPIRPRLVAVGGDIGSGKSTLAHALAPGLGAAPGAVVLRSDVLRKQMLGCDILSRLPPERYDEETTRRTYEILVRETCAALAAGHSVIADATFASPTLRHRIERAAESAGVPFTGIWLRAPLAVREARIAGRRNDASDATVDLARNRPEVSESPAGWIELAADVDADTLAERARSLFDD